MCEISKYSQCISPHRFDVRAQPSQAFWIQPEIMTGSAAFFFHQSYGLEHLKMLRNRGTADRKLSGQLTDGRGAPPQQIQNSLTCRVRERAQQFSLVGHTLR